MSKDARSLKAWQFADELVVNVYAATKTFPKDELYGLTAQMRRAAVSVAANITEGAARKGQQEFLQFLYIASSSLSEVGYYLHLVSRLRYLEALTHRRLAALQQEAARTLQGLLTKIERDLHRR